MWNKKPDESILKLEKDERARMAEGELLKHRNIGNCDRTATVALNAHDQLQPLWEVCGKMETRIMDLEKSPRAWSADDWERLVRRQDRIEKILLAFMANQNVRAVDVRDRDAITGDIIRAVVEMRSTIAETEGKLAGAGKAK